MITILILILFCWLFFKVLGLTFRITWSVAKLLVFVLLLLFVPAIIGCLLAAGGLLLLLPLGVLALLFCVLKVCL